METVKRGRLARFVRSDRWRYGAFVVALIIAGMGIFLMTRGSPDIRTMSGEMEVVYTFFLGLIALLLSLQIFGEINKGGRKKKE